MEEPVDLELRYERDALREALGKVGAWSFALESLTAAEEREAAAEIESLGYGAAWGPQPGGRGRAPRARVPAPVLGDACIPGGDGRCGLDGARAGAAAPHGPGRAGPQDAWAGRRAVAGRAPVLRAGRAHGVRPPAIGAGPGPRGRADRRSGKRRVHGSAGGGGGVGGGPCGPRRAARA